MSILKKIFLICALFFSSCAIIIPGGAITSSPGGFPSSMDRELKEYRAVFHCHCHLSHDSEGSVDEIAQAAATLGFNIVFLNDHYAPGNIAKSPSGLYKDILFVPGVESRFPKAKGMRKRASILATGLERDYDKKMSYEERITEFSKQKSFLVAGHVERLSKTQDLKNFRGFEVYNLHTEFSQANRLFLLWAFLFYPLDCFLETTISKPKAQIERWQQELQSGKYMAPLAGHDAHANITILWRTVNDYPELFRLFSTRILAKKLNKAAIIEALNKGRTFISFDYLGDSRGFSMRYGPLSQKKWAIIGDQIFFTKGARLEVIVPQKAMVRILENGKEILKQETQKISLPLKNPGIYRAEIYKNNKLWILPGPIYIK